MRTTPPLVRPLLGIGLSLSLNACTGPAAEQATSAQPEPAAAASVISGASIVGEWRATGVTIDGKRDPEMDPSGKVRWSIRADSTFAMWDATEGGPDSMLGRWRLDTLGLFRMIDPAYQELTTFQVVRLDADSLRMRVLEQPGTEVLLYFARD